MIPLLVIVLISTFLQSFSLTTLQEQNFLHPSTHKIRNHYQNGFSCVNAVSKSYLCLSYRSASSLWICSRGKLNSGKRCHCDSSAEKSAGFALQKHWKVDRRMQRFLIPWNLTTSLGCDALEYFPWTISHYICCLIFGK